MLRGSKNSENSWEQSCQLRYTKTRGYTHAIPYAHFLMQMEEQLMERHLDVREMSESPAKNLVGGMKTRFRLERDNLAGTGPRDSDMLSYSFHKFQIPTKDSNDLGNLLNMETIKETC